MKKFFSLVFLLFSMSFSSTVFSKEIAEKKAHAPAEKIRELFESLDYPELQVVPRASQRLKIEAIDEKKNWWYVHWPIQVSALSTLTLGFMANSRFDSGLSAERLEDGKTAATAAKLVGGGWLIGTLLIGLQNPYSSGLQNLSKVKGNSRRNQLLRERMAEETLEKAAKLMKRLKTISIATNLVTVVALGSHFDETGIVYTAISGALAFLPMWFEDRHVFVYDKHMLYKRQIYAPMASLGLYPENNGQKVNWQPTFNLSWKF